MSGLVTVLDPGLLTTVQDFGRPGLAHLGVPRAGALDLTAHTLANALVGNDATLATLEVTMTGGVFRFEAPTVVAVTGAPCEVSIGPVLGGDVGAPFASPVRIAAGQYVRVGPARAGGARSYLAARGGVDAERVLGSRSSDTLSGLGPAPLKAGDTLPIGPASALSDSQFTQLRTQPTLPTDGARLQEVTTLATYLGPRDDWFTRASAQLLFTKVYTVSPDSNRVGLRLTGPELVRAREGEIATEGMVLGAIQVPPAGQPVVFLSDHPTTGGYPVIGVVSPRALATAGQLRPGDKVRFSRAGGV